MFVIKNVALYKKVNLGGGAKKRETESRQHFVL